MISQTIITSAFESYLAGQIAAGEVVTLDEFVFAYIEGLDPTVPINPDEIVPAEEDIVWRQAVDKTGVVNEDAVVYSVTLGTGVGDFSFNWVGLINQASGMLGAVTHIPTQDKYATTEDNQGNILTRSFLMGYAGAKLATQISTPAETWQIDFSARLSGIDERQRMENIDLYGVGAFFDTGFLVTSGADSTYTVAPGVGYVGGLRVELSSETPVAVAATPVKIWVDAHWAGTVASIWNTDFVLSAATDLQDYTLNGYQHYVFAIAEISETGEVTDLRPKGTLDGGQQANKYVLKSENLSDLPDKAESRSNLELGTSATKDAQETPTDATAGRLLVNGGWGLGDLTISVSDSELLDPENYSSSLFKQGGGGDYVHFGNYGVGIRAAYGANGPGTATLSGNLFVDNQGNLTVEWLIVSTDGSGATPETKLQKLFGPFNPPSASQITEGHVVGSLSADSFEQHGVPLPGAIQTYMPVIGDFDTAPYGWSMCSGLLTGPDAPSPSYGTLLTLSSNGTGGNTSIPPQSVGHWVQQIFYATDGRISNRYRTNDTPFSPWILQYSTQNPPPTNGITGFRMANYGSTYGNLRDTSGTIMTGIYEDNGYDNPTIHEHRQAQFEVAGTWYNVAYV